MYELRVLNGLHEGASLPLSGENWALGNHEESDLQLCDAEIQTLHAKLSRFEEAWQIEPGEGEVFLAHGQPVINTLSLEANQPFQLSGVWLVVSEADKPWSDSSLIPLISDGTLIEPSLTPKIKLKRKFPLWFKPAVIMLTILMGVILTGWFFNASPSQSKNTDPRPLIADADGLRAILARKLEERDLNKVVTIGGDARGITLNGEVTSTQLSIVNRLMRGLHVDYNIHVPLINDTTLKVLRLPFRIVQINAGKQANIVIEGGRRLFVGDAEDGFTLSKITPNAVQFTGPENISVKW